MSRWLKLEPKKVEYGVMRMERKNQRDGAMEVLPLSFDSLQAAEAYAKKLLASRIKQNIWFTACSLDTVNALPDRY